MFGVVIYATTYFISQELEYKKRSHILIVVGALIILISFSIGGFTGMPLFFSGLGVILFAILLLMLGKKGGIPENYDCNGCLFCNIYFCFL